MAFENLGIGGVLSFDSGGAVTSMGRAQRGFMSLSGSAARLRTGMAELSSGLQRFNLLGVGLGAVAGVGFANFVRSGIEFNKTVESARIAVGGMIQDLAGVPIDQAMNQAADAVSRLNAIAAVTPGELEDVLLITKQLAGPTLAAGGAMNDVLELAKGTTIAAGELGVRFEDAGRATQQLLAGQVEVGNTFVALLKSTRKLTESTEEWKALLPEQRLKRMQEIMGTFAQRADLVGASFEAQISTLASVRKEIAGAFSESLMKGFLGIVAETNEEFFKNREQVLATARALGEKLGKAFGLIIEVVRDLGRSIRDTFDFLKRKVTEAREALAGMGINISEDAIKKILLLASKIGAVVAAASPVIAAIALIGSKIGAVISIAKGLVGVIGGLAGPLGIVLAVVGALFVMFRKEGETPLQTLGRALEKIKEIALELWAIVRPLVDTIVATLKRLGPVIEGALQRMGPVVLEIGKSFVDLLAVVVAGVAQLLPAVEKLVGGIASVVEKLLPGIQILIDAIVRLVAQLLPEIIAGIEPMVAVLVETAEQIASTLTNAFELIAKVVEFLTPILTWIVSKAVPLLVANFKVFAFVIKAAVAVLNVIINVISKIVDILKFVFDVLGAIWRLIAEELKPTWDKIVKVVQDLGEAINTHLIEPITEFAGKVEGFFNSIGSAIDSVVGRTVNLNSILEQSLRITDQLRQAEEERASLAEQQREAEALGVREEAPPRIGAAVNEILVAIGKGVTVNTKTQLEANLCIDGRRVSAATSRHTIETQERAGAERQPWQTRLVKTQGVNPR